MSRGKHLSLEEARKAGKLGQFAAEHPAIGDREKFDQLLGSMASGKKPAKAGTSVPDASAGSSDTRFRRDT